MQQQTQFDFEEIRQDISEVKERLLQILQEQNPEAYSQIKLLMANSNENE